MSDIYAMVRRKREMYSECKRKVEALQEMNKMMLETLKAFSFVPACGGDFCYLIDAEAIEHFGHSGLCDDEGYCRWAFKYEERVKATTNTVLEEIEK